MAEEKKKGFFGKIVKKIDDKLKTKSEGCSCCGDAKEEKKSGRKKGGCCS